MNEPHLIALSGVMIVAMLTMIFSTILDFYFRRKKENEEK